MLSLDVLEQFIADDDGMPVAPDTLQPAEPSLDDCYHQGKMAGYYGIDPINNPCKGTLQRMAWLNGLLDYDERTIG